MSRVVKDRRVSGVCGRKARLAAAGLAAVGFAGCSTPVLPETISPISVYDGKMVAAGKGTAVMDIPSRTGGFIGQYWDPLGDGNGVYGQLDTLYWDQALSGGIWDSYEWRVKKDLPTIGSASGKQPAVEVHPVIPDRTGYVQANLNVCAQMGWPIPDSCDNATAKRAW